MNNGKRNHGCLKTVRITLAVIAALCLLSIVLIQSSKNKAIGMEEQIAAAKSAVDVMQKRRADLIPNLVECVKAYDRHEYETLLAIVEARGASSDSAVQEV